MKKSFGTVVWKYVLILCISHLTFHPHAIAESATADDEFKVELKPAKKSDIATKDDDTEDNKEAVEPKIVPQDKVVSETIDIVDVNAPAEPKEKASPDYVRDIRTIDGKKVYVVNKRAPHLYMVSRDLYGTERSWKAIAEWNSLLAPYNLQPGQQLILKKDPSVSGAEADSVLIKAWTAMNRQDIVKGISLNQQEDQPTPQAAPEVPQNEINKDTHQDH